jgi:hypothetical protein
MKLFLVHWEKVLQHRDGTSNHLKSGKSVVRAESSDHHRDIEAQIWAKQCLHTDERIILETITYAAETV